MSSSPRARAAALAAAVLLASCQDALSPTDARSRDPLFNGLTLTASKASLRLIIEDTTTLSVVASNPAGRTVPHLGSVSWSSSDPAVATVGEDGLVTAIAPGTAALIVEHRNQHWADTVKVTVTYPEEARALWVNRFEWGVTSGDPSGTRATLRAILDSAKRANFNIVYLQVRGEGDAYYPSQLEPCTFRLCGTLGARQPSWDPLAFAIAEAHQRGIQLHAWLNAYTSWSSPTASNASYCARLVRSAAGQPNHMIFDHPEWRMRTSLNVVLTCTNSTAYEYEWVSPGNPGVRTHLARVAADIARRYDVDGIHLDRVRYPSNFLSYDQTSIDLFGSRAPASNTAWIKWRQDAVSQGVKEVYDSLKVTKPSVVLSAAVWGIYEDNWGWNSSRGLMQYFQDSRKWARDGYLDVAVPMTYYNTHQNYCGFADWLCLLDDHISGYAGTNSHMYISINPNTPASKTNAMVLQQIELGRDRGVKGFAFYALSAMNSRKLWTPLAAGPFSKPTSVPHMSWR